MKDHVIQFLLGLILTVLAFVVGIGFSMETPVSVSESYVLISVSLINALWLLPYYLYFHHVNKQGAARRSLLIYLLFVVPFLIIRIHQTRFDSEIWKNSINTNSFYADNPACGRGDMVEDLIDSKILLNKTLDQVESLLGKNHFEMKFYYNRPNTIWYFYSNDTPFEGCDKVYITFENGLSTNAGIGGCD